MARRLLSLDDDILALQKFDLREQAFKDKIHERLQARSEFDPATECVIYTGAWEENGQAKIRVGGRVYCLSRVTAWLYLPDFELWSLHRAVRTCASPACCNSEHVEVFDSQAGALQAQRDRNRLGASHRLTRQKAAWLRSRAAEGVPLDELAAAVGVRVPAVRRVVLGLTWPEK